MIVDLFAATSDGCFALLQPAMAEINVPVGTNLPEDTTPPFVMIGNVEILEPDSEHDEQLERVRIEIITLYRGTSRAELHAIMQAERVALDKQLPIAAGVAFGTLRFVGGSSSGPGEDGVTHAGIIEFEVLAQPAD
jgi:hypothetical protein